MTAYAAGKEGSCDGGAFGWHHARHGQARGGMHAQAFLDAGLKVGKGLGLAVLDGV